MNSGKKPFGYTIVEVLIVLAVSGLMFVIAANFINGKQANTSFTQGVNEMASRLQDIIEQVTDGQYSDVPLDCTYSAPAQQTTPNGGGQNQQGTGHNLQPQCVFLGKMVHLSVNGVADQYEVFSLAGGRVNGDKPVTDLHQADPQVVTRLTIDQTMPQHLDVSNIAVNDSVAPAYIFGFLQSQGSLDAANSLHTSAQSILLYYVVGSGASLDNAGAVSRISTDASSPPNKKIIIQVNKLEICLTDGNRYGSVILGGANGQLSTTVKIYGTTQPPQC